MKGYSSVSGGRAAREWLRTLLFFPMEPAKLAGSNSTKTVRIFTSSIARRGSVRIPSSIRPNKSRSMIPVLALRPMAATYTVGGPGWCTTR